jgi:hypothetical protein
MLLMLDYGIFYEFMPMSEFGKKDPETVLLNEVEIGQNYALIISTNAGLWRYLVGDTVRFTCLAPFRIQVTGRTRHFINAFGEELIIDNAEEAVKRACAATGAKVNDYTACPVYMSETEAGGHEWLFEFEELPSKLSHFASHLDTALKEVNSDYAAKRSSSLSLREPTIHVAPAGTFYAWMVGRGKVGGQNKVPRLSNERKYMEDLISFMQNKQEETVHE